MKSLVFDSRKRNYLLIIICAFAYFSTLLLKLSYTANIVNIEQKYSVSHSDTGLVSALFLISYGLGQFVNGIFVRKYNIKYIIPLSIFISIILNILFYFTTVDKFYLVKFYWLINGAVLSLFWPCVIRHLSEHLSDRYREKSALILAGGCSIGTCIIYALSSLFTFLGNYSLIFIIASIIGALAIVVWFYFYKKTSEVNEDVIRKKDQPIETTKARYYFVIYALLCGLLCIVATFGRDGLTNWAPSILNDEFNISNSLSVLIAVILPIGNLLGVILASFLKKRIVSHILLSTLFLAVIVLAMFFGYLFNFENKFVLMFIMIVVILSATVIMYITCDILPLAWAKERNSGLFAGVFSGCSFVGAASATYVLSVIADNKGWNVAFKVILITYAVMLVICIFYCTFRSLYRFKVAKKD